MKELSGIAALLGAGFLILGAPSTDARQHMKRCRSVEVRSLKASPKILEDMPLDARQETIEGHVQGGTQRHLSVVARGPVLGSMDSERVDIRLTCSGAGLAMTATITRSGHYHGAVLQNQLWFPEITLDVVPLEPDFVFQTTWKMHLTDGKVVERFRTPPYPERRYPLVLAKRFTDMVH